ncbi:NUDIX hydrolase [Asanoa sp. WMMD1127]|uniref:NUDIX hydrolase n=1 Tax=Asanoa sp. WMMD1127 TaxID=3016107 RepID=UPI002417B3BE|nr:NUDIX hydrolase [Asanoa sp. WMMD1127]MDG4827021.1 NUDIX hydrolase [Asanoa sp. WMMD1127]
MNSLTSAVAAIVTDDAGRVLLCQQSQGHRRWGLPGGKVRENESPIHAAVRDIREETGMDVEMVDMVGLYELRGQGLPDVVVHVFRCRDGRGEALVNAPGRICRLSWHEPDDLPQPMTPTTRTALAHAFAGRSGVVCEVDRDAEPDYPDAADTSDARSQDVVVGLAG